MITQDMRSQHDITLHIGNAVFAHNINNQRITKAQGSKQDKFLHIGNLSIS